MSLANEQNGMVMPVTPMGGGYGGGFGNGMWGDGSLIWLLILFLFAFNGNGFGFGGGFGGGAMPYMMNNNIDNGVQRGFDQQAVIGGINGIQTAINGVQNSLCNGFAGVNQGVANGFAQAEIAANARNMADMNQNFAIQTAMNQGFNATQAQLAQCCCDNRLATANLSADIARENCADRQATMDAMNALSNKIDGLGNQLIAMNYQNQLAQKDGIITQKDDIIAQLRSEALYNRGQASQDIQTGTIQAGQRALANEIEQYVAPKAIPAYVVQNPNCCGQQYGWNGCGVA